MTALGSTPDGGVVGAPKGHSTKFGTKRVRTTAISEQAIVGAAIGASIVGMRPVAEMWREHVPELFIIPGKSVVTCAGSVNGVLYLPLSSQTRA